MNAPAKTNSPDNKKGILIVVGFLILAVTAFYFVSKNNLNTLIKDSDDGEITEEQKNSILEQLENTNVPEVTEAQKNQILQQLENTKGPEITEEQKNAILEQLSKTSQ